MLEPIYESAGEWDRVIAVYEVMQAHSEDPVRTVELLSYIAEIEERRLSHQNAAFDVYGRALRVDPNNQDVLAHLERLAAETGHWAKLANLLASEIEKVDETRRAIDLLLRLARVYEEETGQLEEAIATYRRAIEADPDSKTALVALDRLYGRAQQWDELADVVRREIRIAPTDEDRIALTFRLAQIYELALVDMPKAVDAYREILTADPTHAETRAALERMFLGGTMQAEIADVLEPLYKTGEEWEKLHRISRGAARSADRRHRAADAAPPPGRDRRAQAGRSGRGVRMVGGGGQGGSVVGARARRAAAPGARDPPVGRLRHAR